jgi:precorrin-3B synthase
MNRVTGQRRGFCPSLWTPMESGDGLLVRVRPAHGARGIDAVQLRELVRLASKHGNGLIEVTRRARLQLRGVRTDSLIALQMALVRLGLAESSAAHASVGPVAPVARSAALIVNPYSGLSWQCAQLDPMAEDLEQALAASPECASLSDKFGVVLDSGYALNDIAADIHLDVAAGNPGRVSVHVATHTGAWAWLGECRPLHAAAIVVELCRALSEAGKKRRMRDLVVAQGIERLRERVASMLLRAAGSQLPAAIWTAVGFHQGRTPWLELGVAFGSGGPEVWQSITEIASRLGTGEIRCTPWRSVILPGLSKADREDVEILQNAGLIIDSDDPLLRAVACSGAPACSSAQGETRLLARELAPLLGSSESLHISGCAKGCAKSDAADVTLVLAPDGCALGFDQSVAETKSAAVISLAAAREEIAQLQARSGIQQKPAPLELSTLLPDLTLPESPAVTQNSISSTRALAHETSQVQARGPATRRD